MFKFSSSVTLLVGKVPFWFQVAPPVNHSIKMEVGIEECLHIEFEYDKSKYHLEDVVIGKVYFLLVRIKIKSMELAIVKRESAGRYCCHLDALLHLCA